MIKLGITGGIGSGKSTVSNIFEILDIPVYIADIESKKITESSPVIRKKLIAAFGENLYDGEKLNKPLLASYIFNDKKKLAIANSIIHPEVGRHFCEWASFHKDKPVIALESAILFESGIDKLTDKNIVVYTPLEIRIQRVVARDNVSREKVMERINSQMTDEEKTKKGDFLIYNDDTKSLIQQSLSIVDILLK